MRTKVLTLAGLCAAAAWTPAMAASPITISGAEVRASLGGSTTSAAYMVIANHGEAADRLMSVDCACAARTEIHVTRNRNGVTSMEPTGPVAVPAHGRVSFSPDGLHVMLMGLKGELRAGQVQPMTLHFEHAGAVTARFAVRSQITGGGMGGMSGMGGMGAMPGMSH
jgi:hypothetical protein